MASAQAETRALKRLERRRSLVDIGRGASSIEEQSRLRICVSPRRVAEVRNGQSELVQSRPSASNKDLRNF
jgi:hypothetical protein